MNFLLVFIGGGFGCLIRYLIGLSFLRITTSLPLATFVSNSIACLIFGITIYLINQKSTFTADNTEFYGLLKLLILTGFCGGLSTFSTFGYETFLLLKQGLHVYAFLNIIFSSVICLLIFFVFTKHIS